MALLAMPAAAPTLRAPLAAVARTDFARQLAREQMQNPQPEQNSVAGFPHQWHAAPSQFIEKLEEKSSGESVRHNPAGRVPIGSLDR